MTMLRAERFGVLAIHRRFGHVLIRVKKQSVATPRAIDSADLRNIAGSPGTRKAAMNRTHSKTLRAQPCLSVYCASHEFIFIGHGNEERAMNRQEIPLSASRPYRVKRRDV